MFNPDSKPGVPLPKFSKHLHGTESSEDHQAEGVTVRLGLHQQVEANGASVWPGREEWAGVGGHGY